MGTNGNHCPYLTIGLGTRLLGSGCASRNCSYPTPYPASANDSSSIRRFFWSKRRFSRDGVAAFERGETHASNGPVTDDADIAHGKGAGWIGNEGCKWVEGTEGDDDGDDARDEGGRPAAIGMGEGDSEAALLMERSCLLRSRHDGALVSVKDDDASDDDDDDDAATADDDEEEITESWEG